MTDRIEAEAPQDRVSSNSNLLQDFEIGSAGMSQLKASAEEYMKVELELPQISMYDTSDSAITKPAVGSKEEIKQAKPEPELAEHGKVKEHTPASPSVPFEMTKYEDGTTRQTFPTGDIVETRPNGDYVHMKPDHSITVIHDGKQTTISPIEDRDFKTAKVDDFGNVTIDYKDGAQEWYGEDGAYGITFPDKSGYWIEPDGGYTIFHANGDNKSYNDKDEQISEWTHDEAGARIHYPKNRQVDSVIAPDGQRRDFLYDKDGNLEKFDGHLGTWTKEQRDGKDVWVNQQTRAEWEGKMTVDSKGNLHFKPSNGGQGYVFTPDGRDIKK